MVDRCEGVPFDEQLVALVALLDHELKRDETARFAGAPLTAAQFSIARSLDEVGSLTIGELATAGCCVPANITALVDRLERKGLAERMSRPGDRRVTSVALTATGKQALDRTSAVAESRCRRISAVRTAAQLQSLVAGLGSLYVDLVGADPRSDQPGESPESRVLEEVR